MKTLDQLEPRTPLEAGVAGVALDQNGGLRIQSSGSYFLTRNLIVASGNAITIEATKVTLDLNGFTLASVADDNVPRGIGIEVVNPAISLTIRNGHIRGSVTQQSGGAFSGRGFATGISVSWPAQTAPATGNVLVENVTVEGVMNTGILLENLNGLIRACAANHCGLAGLWANSVTESTADHCGTIAIVASQTAANSSGSGAGGIFCATATNCSGVGTTSNGLSAKTATNCRGTSGSGAGISAQSVANSYGISTTGCGINATTVTGSSGESTDGPGIQCTVAGDSFGYSANLTGLACSTATNCYGNSHAGWGLSAQEATNCHGLSNTGAFGLHAESTATGCTGEITTAVQPAPASSSNMPCGLYAANAAHCSGLITSATGTCRGLDASTAEGCTGVITTATWDANAPSMGLFATNAANSIGQCANGIGLRAGFNAVNCTGFSTKSYGIYAYASITGSYGSSAEAAGIGTMGTASFCRGYTGTGSFAIESSIAVACTAENGGILAYSSKQLGTP